MRRCKERRSFRGPGAFALVAALAAPGPAVAQAPVGLPDLPAVPAPSPAPPPTGPPQPTQPPGRPPAPPPGDAPKAGDVVSYRQNPAGSGVAAQESVAGPLEIRWTRQLSTPASQPLVAGGLIVVSSGDRIDAFDIDSGRPRWGRPVGSVSESARLAIDRGRVLAASEGGAIRAFALQDGRLLWTIQLPGDDHWVGAPPVAAAGRLFVWTYGGTSLRGTLIALSVADGSELWRRARGLDRGTDPPALDGERVFVADECGNVDALTQATGAVVWQGRASETCGVGGEVRVGGGRVWVGGHRGLGAWTYDAATGGPPVRFGAVFPEAVASDLVVRRGDAFGQDGRRLWRYPVPDGTGVSDGIASIVVGPTVFASGESGRLYSLDRSTGRLMWRQNLPDSALTSFDGVRPGMSAGGGVLAVALGTRVTVYESVFAPPARGVELLASSYRITAGGRTALFYQAGRALRGRRFVLETDPYPYGRFTDVRRLAMLADGSGSVYDRENRNARVRVRVAGTRISSAPITVTAYFRSKQKWRWRGPRTLDLTTRVTAPGFPFAGRTLVAYLGRGRTRVTFRRLGVARLRGGRRGSGVARFRIQSPPKARSKDFIVYCIPRDRSFGGPDAVNRRCGAVRIRE